MTCDQNIMVCKTNPITTTVGVSDGVADASQPLWRAGNSVESASTKRVFSPSLMSDPDGDIPRVKTNPTKPHRPHRLWRWAFWIVAGGGGLLRLPAVGGHPAPPRGVYAQGRG